MPSTERMIDRDFFWRFAETYGFHRKTAGHTFNTLAMRVRNKPEIRTEGSIYGRNFRINASDLMAYLDRPEVLVLRPRNPRRGSVSARADAGYSQGSLDFLKQFVNWLPGELAELDTLDLPA